MRRPSHQVWWSCCQAGSVTSLTWGHYAHEPLRLIFVTTKEGTVVLPPVWVS
jgi:hypothetical protein